MEKHISLRDIAKRAGVHFTTAGLALRHDPRVNAATGERIRTIARELGYTQDAMLSALSTYRHRNAKRHAGVIACLSTYPLQDQAHNITEREQYEGLSRYAQTQGFGVDFFQQNTPGMTPERLSQLLVARGIQGLILLPRMPEPGPMPDLAWENFSPVAIGYSITAPRLHRVISNHAHNIRLALRQLRARGYRRVGMVLPYRIYERTLGIVPGTFLSEQYLLPVEDRVEPLIDHEITKAKLGHWIRAQRLDGVLLTAFPRDMLEWIRALGYDVPGDLGVGCAQLYGDSTGFAGVDYQTELIGEAAANFVISLLQQNERGLPAYPRTLSVEGRWVEGGTVRPSAS